MIVKHNFKLSRIWPYIRLQASVSAIWTAIICSLALYEIALSIPFSVIGVLGSALAIFVAFRNNSAYGRWWEARQLWGGIVNSSRVFGRLIITFTDSHKHQENYIRERSEAFKSDMIRLAVAWVHALRLQLREQEDWDSLHRFMSEEDFTAILQKSNKVNFIHLLMGQKIYVAMSNGTLGGFDSFQLEGQLLALTNYQGGAERIKKTPLPRQYDFFTRVFLWLFILLLPGAMVGLFPRLEGWNVLLPATLTVLIALVFIIMERTGAANEDPFENKVTDVPLTAICTTIERDLIELLGEQDLPAAMKPMDGYLY